MVGCYLSAKGIEIPVKEGYFFEGELSGAEPTTPPPLGKNTHKNRESSSRSIGQAERLLQCAIVPIMIKNTTIYDYLTAGSRAG